MPNMRDLNKFLTGLVGCLALTALPAAARPPHPLEVSPPSSTLTIGKSFLIRVSGGTAPYGVKDMNGLGDVAPGTEANTFVYTAAQKSGRGSVRVRDAAGKKISIGINIRPSLAVTPKEAKLLVGASQKLEVSGGVTPFTYTLSSAQGDLQVAADGFSATYFAPSSAGQVDVRITDAEKTQLVVPIEFASPLSLSSSSQKLGLGESFKFKVAGGFAPYTVDTSAVGGALKAESDGVTFTYTAPRNAASGDLVVSDSNGASARLNVTVQAPAGSGLLGQYYTGKDFKTLSFTRVDPNIDFDFTSGPDPRLGLENYSIRWLGQITVPTDGTYVFYANSDDGVHVWIDNNLVINDYAEAGVGKDRNSSNRPLALKAGRKYDFKLEYFQNKNGAAVKLSWKSNTGTKEVIPPSAFTQGYDGKVQVGSRFEDHSLIENTIKDCYNRNGGLAKLGLPFDGGGGPYVRNLGTGLIQDFCQSAQGCSDTNNRGPGRSACLYRPAGLDAGGGASLISGAIFDKYQALEGASGLLGFPVGDAKLTATGQYQDFDNGRIEYFANASDNDGVHNLKITMRSMSFPAKGDKSRKADFFVIGVDVPTRDLIAGCPAQIPPTGLTDRWRQYCPMLKWMERGVNTMVRIPNGDDFEGWNYHASRRGLYMVRPPRTDLAKDSAEKYLLAWSLEDEPDLHGRERDPDLVALQYARLKDADPTIPVFLNYSGGDVVGRAGNVARKDITYWRDLYYHDLAASGDIMAHDIYPITGWGHTSFVDLLLPGPFTPKMMVGTGTDILRTLSTGATNFDLNHLEVRKAKGKPQWVYLESSDQQLWWIPPADSGTTAAGKPGNGRLKINPDGWVVTADEFRGEVWHSVIHGADGIVYFPEVIGHWSFDGTPKYVVDEMTKQNGLLTKWSDVLISDGAQWVSNVPLPFEIADRNFGGAKYRIVLNFSHSCANLDTGAVDCAKATPNVTYKPFEVRLFKNGALVGP